MRIRTGENHRPGASGEIVFPVAGRYPLQQEKIIMLTIVIEPSYRRRKAVMSADNPKVSVLIPVYNSERYLRQCLDSIVSQTLEDIQIICIDDGATDSSPQILKEYARKDCRIDVITKENSGYGASMNRGLDAARGRYVAILESDDFAEPNMLQAYYEVAEKHDLDLVKSNYFEHSESGDEKIVTFGLVPRLWGTFNPEDHPKVLLSTPLIWSGLYRRFMLTHNNIRFTETPGASYQDSSFVHRCWFAAKKVRVLPDAYVHYRIDNENSSVKSRDKVYAICTEYEADGKYLDEHPCEWTMFAPWLEVSRFLTYRWNYNRIAPEHREGFAKKWAEEIRIGTNNRTIQRSYFNVDDWAQMDAIVSDPVKFAEEYRDKDLPVRRLPWNSRR